jgi:hypothetical protein
MSIRNTSKHLLMYDVSITPDFTAGSFVTIAVASTSFETSSRTAPSALTLRC